MIGVHSPFHSPIRMQVYTYFNKQCGTPPLGVYQSRLLIELMDQVMKSNKCSYFSHNFGIQSSTIIFENGKILPMCMMLVYNPSVLIISLCICIICMILFVFYAENKNKQTKPRKRQKARRFLLK